MKHCLHTKECPICHKKFIPGRKHLFKMPFSIVLVCGYGCREKARREYEDRKVKLKSIIESAQEISIKAAPSNAKEGSIFLKLYVMNGVRKIKLPSILVKRTDDITTIARLVKKQATAKLKEVEYERERIS